MSKETLLSPDPSNYTPRACQAVARARKEAEALHHDLAGTPHLLLALINLGEGTAIDALRKASGLGSRALSEKIRVSIGAQAEGGEFVGYTRGFKVALHLAKNEAQKMGQTSIGTEHLLLGLMDDKTDSVIMFQQVLGVDPAVVRHELLTELDPNYTIPSAEASRSAETDVILHHILDELLRKYPLPWHIRGDGPYEVISNDSTTIARDLRGEDARAIIDCAKKRQG